MSRHVRSRIVLSAVLLAGSVVAAGEAHAVSSPDPVSLAVPDQAAAMRRDLGLTEQQVSERLDRESAAIRLAPVAQRAAGAAFGGSWYDAARQQLVVGLTDQRRADAVRATGVATAAVPLPAATLDRVKARVDVLAGRSAPAAVSGWAADPRSGSVVVNVQAGRHGPAVDAFVAKVRKAGPVTVRQVVAERPGTFAAGTVGGDPYYTGNVRCSIGFSVHGGYVTAGHCGGAGSFVRGWDGSDQGWFRGSSFPGNDYAWVEVGYGWWTVPVVIGWGQVPDSLVRGLVGGPTRYVGLPLGLDHALALRAGPGAQRDGELRQRRGRLRADQDQRLCRGRRLRRFVYHR